MEFCFFFSLCQIFGQFEIVILRQFMSFAGSGSPASQDRAIDLIAVYYGIFTGCGLRLAGWFYLDIFSLQFCSLEYF